MTKAKTVGDDFQSTALRSTDDDDDKHWSLTSQGKIRYSLH